MEKTSIYDLLTYHLHEYDQNSENIYEYGDFIRVCQLPNMEKTQANKKEKDQNEDMKSIEIRRKEKKAKEHSHKLQTPTKTLFDISLSFSLCVSVFIH